MGCLCKLNPLIIQGITKKFTSDVEVPSLRLSFIIAQAPQEEIGRQDRNDEELAQIGMFSLQLRKTKTINNLQLERSRTVELH